MQHPCLMLLLILHQAPKVTGSSEQLFAATGSSVLLTFNNISEIIGFLQWEYKKGPTQEGIVDYFKLDSKIVIYDHYEGRVQFHTSNGSLELRNAQVNDSGTYVVTVNLKKNLVREILLLVIDPVSKPGLQTDSTLADTPIQLSCVVEHLGTVKDIVWKKNGQLLHPDCHYVFSEDFRVLQIQNGQKSDCGSYSCNVSNEVSWDEASLDLVIDGLKPFLKQAQKISAAASFLAWAATLDLLVLYYLSGKKRVGVMSWRWPCVGFLLLLFGSCLLLAVASGLWIQEEGISLVFLLMLFLVMGIIVMLLVAVILALSPVMLQAFKAKPWTHTVLDTTLLGGMVLNVLFNSLLLRDIQHQQRKGCSPDFDWTAATVIVSVVSLSVFLVVFVWYQREIKYQEAPEKKLQAEGHQKLTNCKNEEHEAQL
ncbi:natural killer cell receptor 2B4-like [Rhea pennata]|uniref:natural killer cell receptor 2B4-like n=1 Tax=Rhea pennata TaxID=8795 RepID=UPI002E258065